MSASGPGDRFVGGEVVLTLAGAASSALAVGVIWFGSAFLDFDLSTLTLWFIVPAGAVATGMLAASGYYLGASWTGRRPTRLLLLNMVLVGFTTFVVLRYLAYSGLVFEDGTPISTEVGFWQYYRVSIEHMTMTVGRSANPDIGTTGELGMLGYGVETLQFAGFLLGPVAVWFMQAFTWMGYGSWVAAHSASTALAVGIGYARSLSDRFAVGGNVKAPTSGCFDLFARLAYQRSPTGLVSRFKVIDLDWQSTFFADRDRLVYRLYEVLPFTAYMAGVYATVTPGDFG